jgi:hypothetical protein
MLGVLETRVHELRARWKEKRGELNERLRRDIESDPSAIGGEAVWRTEVQHAWTDLRDTESFAKETIAQASADARATRKRLGQEIEALDQLSINFDDANKQPNTETTNVPERAAT